MGCSSSTLRIEPTEPTEYININTMNCCYNSWEEMKQQPNNRSNSIFLNLFFDIMLTKNPTTFTLLTPKPISRRSKDKSTLLLRIIDYILTLCDCSMNTKHSLRAMGRSHLRVGIGQEHMIAFKDTFLEAFHIINKGNWFISREMIAWNMLLSFIVEQMCFEKIVFFRISNIYTKSDEKVCEERSQLSLSLLRSSHKWSLNNHSSNSSSSSSGRQIHLNPSIVEIMNMNQQFDLAANIPDTIEDTSETLSGSLVPIIVVQQPEVYF